MFIEWGPGLPPIKILLPVDRHADHDVNGGRHEAVEGRQGQVCVVEGDRVVPRSLAFANCNESGQCAHLLKNI